jgi:MerR family transcriptional regulator, light-induced transcriptional regulator
MNPRTAASFGERLKYFRNERRLTQRELGDLLGVSQETITNYERGGRFPRPDTLQAIAKLLDLSIDDLLGDQESAPEVESGGPVEFSHEQLIGILGQEPLDRALVYAANWKVACGFTLAEAYQKMLIPVLVRIGLLWHQGDLSVADEHHMSEKIRDLAVLLANSESRAVPVRPDGGRRWMGLCAPGEKHDLALLLHSLVLRQAGWQTRFLGTQVPLADLFQAIEIHRPQVLGLSVTMEDNVEGAALYVQRIRARFGERPAIIVGGQGVARSGPGLTDAVDALTESIAEGVTLAERFATAG